MAHGSKGERPRGRHTITYDNVGDGLLALDHKPLDDETPAPRSGVGAVDDAMRRREAPSRRS